MTPLPPEMVPPATIVQLPMALPVPSSSQPMPPSIHPHAHSHPHPHPHSHPHHPHSHPQAQPQPHPQPHPHLQPQDLHAQYLAQRRPPMGAAPVHMGPLMGPFTGMGVVPKRNMSEISAEDRLDPSKRRYVT